MASIDAGRQMLLVRRTLEDCPRQVLHLKVRDLVGEITEASRREWVPWPASGDESYRRPLQMMRVCELSGLSGFFGGPPARHLTLIL